MDTIIDFFIAFAAITCIASGLNGQCGEAPVYWLLDESTKTVTFSGSGALKQCNVIPNYNSIQSAIIKRGFTTIDQMAFANWDSLSSVTIPDSVTTINNNAFRECGLPSIHIPKSVETMDGLCFFGCTKLASITVDEENPFFSAKKGVLFNKNKTTLLKYPPAKASDNYAIPRSVTKIGPGAFAYSDKLQSITIRNGVTSIEEFCFQKCAFSSIAIPASVNTIRQYAFGSNSNLELVSYYGTNDAKSSSSFEVFPSCPKLQHVCVLPLYRDSQFCLKDISLCAPPYSSSSGLSSSSSSSSSVPPSSSSQSSQSSSALSSLSKSSSSPSSMSSTASSTPSEPSKHSSPVSSTIMDVPSMGFAVLVLIFLALF